MVVVRTRVRVLQCAMRGMQRFWIDLLCEIGNSLLLFLRPHYVLNEAEKAKSQRRAVHSVSSPKIRARF